MSGRFGRKVVKHGLKRDAASVSTDIAALRKALEPFAEVEIPIGSQGTDVYLYIGTRDQRGEAPHLKLAHFLEARRQLGLA